MADKIIITGATGLIGRNLAGALISQGYELIVFSRDTKKARSVIPAAKNYVEWDYNNLAGWSGHFENSYAVIHLAGANLAGKRFTKAYKRKVRNSRIISTRNIVQAIEGTKNKPAVFICSSGINYYGDSGNEILTENSGAGSDFLAELCREWEDEAAKAEEMGVRRISVRTSPVLSTRDAMLKKLLPLFRLYLGASLGSGKQWLSWIHIEDIVNVYLYSLKDDKITGPVNASSPEPVSMNDFADRLGEVLDKPVFFRVPKFAMKAMIGEAADFITASLRVIPEKLEETGFKFAHPHLTEALSDVVANKK